MSSNRRDSQPPIRHGIRRRGTAKSAAPSGPDQPTAAQSHDGAPAGQPGRLRRWMTGRTLRTRLVAVMIGLLAVLVAGISLGMVVLFDQAQIRQIDDQLKASDRRAKRAVFPGEGAEPPPGWTDPNAHNHGKFDNQSDLCVTTQSDQSAGTLSAPATPTPKVTSGDTGQGTGGQVEPGQGDPVLVFGQIVGTLFFVACNGQVTKSSISNDSGQVRALTDEAKAELLKVVTDGKRGPLTVDLGVTGRYRVLVTVRPDGATIVTGIPLHEAEERIQFMLITDICVGLLALVLAGLVGAAVIRLTLRPLSRVAAAAGRVTELTLHEGEVALIERVPPIDTDPRTEVGQVGAALNRMLGHVDAALSARQASETRLRRFVADASHELRTPLAAIRGYAELTHRYRPATPPDVAYALDRVEAAAGRMTALVEDLLLLARLDAGRPLAADEVDLSTVVVEAISDAYAASPEHQWRLAVPEDAVTVVGDAARLHQVIANLLANARTHTPPGTAVTLALDADPAGQVRLSVIDNGPGIPAELQPHIFQRFARGDSARSRTAGSTGLGLAIVAAIVAAHGGTVRLESVPGNTVFTIVLPAAAPAA